MKNIILHFILIFLTLSTSFAQDPVANASKSLQTLLDKPAPTFEIVNLEGEKYTLESLQGQVVVLNFWFTACGPCIKEIPILNEIVEKYKQEEIHFLAPAYQNSRELLLQWTQRRTFKYILVPSAENIAKLYGIRIYPTHVIIDREGIVRFVKVGYHPNIKSILEKEIQKLLIE